ncbi:MAG: BlaI/MecI/CopY family transcriptional regulator, partial [Flavobacteriales bacterium]
SKHLHGIIKNFFHNNLLQFASFFIEETNFTKAELKEFKSIIHSELKKK